MVDHLADDTGINTQFLGVGGVGSDGLTGSDVLPRCIRRCITPWRLLVSNGGLGCLRTEVE